MKIKTLGRFLGGLFSFALLSCGNPSDPIRVTISPETVQPVAPTLGEGTYERPLAAVAELDESGALIPDSANTFVENEIVFAVSDFSDVEGLLLERGWTDFTTNAAAPFMEGIFTSEELRRLSAAERAEFSRVTQVVVRLASLPEPLNVWRTQAAEMIEDSGHYVFSSENAVRLFALIASLHDEGFRVSANFLGVSDGVGTRVDRTEDEAGRDYMAEPIYSADGARTGVREAWQYLWMRQDDPYTPVRVAILDGGFYFDRNGDPQEGRLDFRVNPWTGKVLQIDFEEGDNTVDRRNPARCTGGSPCPYHGRMAATVATAVLDNGISSAGVGGPVAEPLLIHLDLRLSEMTKGLAVARMYDAAVISMSFGVTCKNRFCDFGVRFMDFEGEVNRTFNAGVTMVAAAGNDEKEIRSQSFAYPCTYENVICVGATNPDNTQMKFYSNYGERFVDIFAPTDIPIMSPDDEGVFVNNRGTGTSASTPFVAGAIALLKAVNPDLDPAGIRTLLRETAWQGEEETGDARVTHAINVLQAVRRAAGERMPADRFSTPGFVNLGTLADGASIEIDQLTIESPLDEEILQFTLPERSNVELIVESVASFGGIAAQFAVQSGAIAPTRRDVVQGGTRTIYLNRLQAGTYRMRLRPERGSRSPERVFRVEAFARATRSLFPDIFDQGLRNDTVARATTLWTRSLSSEKLNHETRAGDPDWFEIRIAMGRGTPEEFIFSLMGADYPVYSDLFVAESDGSVGTAPDASALGRTREWVFSVPGLYYLRTRPNGTDSGEYVLTFGRGRRGPRPHVPGSGGASVGNIWRIPPELGWIDFTFLRGPEFFEAAPGGLPSEVFLQGNARLLYVDRTSGEVLVSSVSERDLQGANQEVLRLSPALRDLNGFVVVAGLNSLEEFEPWAEDGFVSSDTLEEVRIGWAP